MINKLLKPFYLPQIFFLIYFLLIFSFPTILSATELKIVLSGDLLTLSAEKVELQTILRNIAQNGVTVKIDPQINPVINANFNNRPVEQALETLLKSESYSLLWESRSDQSGKTSVQLAEIQVFRSGRKNLMKSLLPKKINEINKNSEGLFYVKDEIILYLLMGTNIQELNKLIQGYGATLIYNGKLPGAAKILLPPDSDVSTIARKIAKKLDIAISQPNYAYPLESPVNYLIEAQQVNISPGSPVFSESKVPIAILDSGLAENSELDKLVISSLDIMNPGTPITDTLGHGTQMAYIASGVIKPYGSDSDTTNYMPIIPIRAFDDNGYTTDFNIMNSINYALENNARVISLSWGSETRSEFMEKAFEYGREQGLIIVASAGNEPTGELIYPAAYSSVIGVGALGPHGKTWENSNYGNFVTLYAPGFASLPVGYKGDPGMYAGTSIATALVANSIADFLSRKPDASTMEIENFISKKYKK